MKGFNFNVVEIYEEPRKKILPKLDSKGYGPEMSEFESGFLCGLIKEFRPDTIVEAGVAGGTTAVILQCLLELGMHECDLYSIDYSEKFYRDKNLKTGFMGEQAKQLAGIPFRHHVCLGNIACNYMKQYGCNIDFLIIDTMHILPGEILDFITLLPYLKDGCIVVLHDISYGLISDLTQGYATSVLFSAVTAEKYLNYDKRQKGRYPNIGAFRVSDETRRNAGNLFLSLIITWSYLPDMKQLKEYRKAVREHYSEEMLEIFDNAVRMNYESWSRNRKLSVRCKKAVQQLRKFAAFMKHKLTDNKGYGKQV